MRSNTHHANQTQQKPSCGCTSGMVAALTAAGIYLFTQGHNARIVTGVVIFFSAAVVGKLTGILYDSLRHPARS
jgi:sulfur transfer protein SufE